MASLDQSIRLAPFRSFSGEISLKAVSGNRKDHIYGRTAVNSVWKKWAVSRHAQGKPSVGIMVGYTQESLSSIESGDNDELAFKEVPMVTVQGELNSGHDDLSDAEIIETLKSLFCHIGKALGQNQVQFKFFGDEDKYMCSYNLMYSPKQQPVSSRSLARQYVETRYSDC